MSKTTALNPENRGSAPARRHLSERAVLAILLLVALVNGLIFVFLMPPWQHYDEPGHFEVVWLAANQNRLPTSGDYNPELSRAVVVSMIQNRFYGPDTTAGLPAEGEPVQVPGYRQLDEPPGYYLFAALPLRLARLFGVEAVAAQLRAARLASLALFLLVVLCAWGITAELTRPGHVLRWMVPLSLALLPGFVDLMTAVNNDVGAIAAFSLFLWGAVRLVQRRFSWVNLAWCLAAVVLCTFTKVTALFAAALFPIAVLLSLGRGRLRWLAWAALGLAGLALLAVTLSWGDAGWWARNTLQEGSTRVETPQAPLGTHAFQLSLPAGSSATYDFQLHQLIDLPQGVSLQGQEVTVGAWMWADRPLLASSPVLNTFAGLKKYQTTAELTETPQFVAFTAPIEGDAQRNFISLAPLVQAGEAPTNVYFDGIVVVPGRWPLDQPPEFADSRGETGIWGGQPFQNLLRNPSAETAWVRLRPWVDRLGVRLLPDKGANQPSVTLYYFLDQAGTAQFQRESIQVLFRTFWARFGWGHVPLLHPWAYGLILVVMLSGILAALAALWRLRKSFPWRSAFLLGLALLGISLQTLMRGANYPTQLRAIYYPTARYAYPAIIPALLWLNLGWYEIGRGLKNGLRLPGQALAGLYIAGWVIFDLYAILSIARFYA